MENKDIINLLYDTMRDRGVWFTTDIDYTFGKKDCYKLNEYGKLANEKEENKVVKEINNYIGDGAVNELEAIGCWLNNAMFNDYSIAYTSQLHMDFKDEPIVDNIKASLVDLEKRGGYNAIKAADITKGPELIEESKTQQENVSIHKLSESVDWSYYNDPRFNELDDKYLPDSGEGNTKATQIVTAVNKLIYKWYNDGDVYDNVNSGLNGWANDLSDYANWLYKYVPASKHILETIEGIYTESEYEDLLKELADTLLTEEFLAQENEEPKVGSIYECSGPFQFDEHWDDEEEEDYYNEDDNFDDDDYNEEEFEESKKITETKSYTVQDIENLYNKYKSKVDEDNTLAVVLYCGEPGEDESYVEEYFKNIEDFKKYALENDLSYDYWVRLEEGQFDEDDDFDSYDTWDCVLLENKQIKTEAEEDIDIKEDIDVEDDGEDIVDTSIKPEDKIRQRTQDLYNLLTDNGLDVNIDTDNGENQIEVLLNNRDGKIIIPVREDNVLEPITGGNISLDDESLKTLEQVKDILSKEEV